MSIGSGKYDVECAAIMDVLKASTVVLMVMGGKRGHGASLKTTSIVDMAIMPNVLREMADELEKDVRRAAEYEAK